MILTKKIIIECIQEKFPDRLSILIPLEFSGEVILYDFNESGEGQAPRGNLGILHREDIYKFIVRKRSKIINNILLY